MKILLLSLCAMILFRTTRFDFLDLNSTDCNITWADITEDLWP